MKKFLLALVVIVSFALYALSQKSIQSGNPITKDQNTDNTVPVPTVVDTNTVPAPIVVNKGMYKDGEYTGSSVNVIYGNVQVKAVIKGGRLADIVYLDFPRDKSHSLDVSNYAMPILKSEAITAQSAEVDSISGATEFCAGFTESLGGALTSAKN